MVSRSELVAACDAYLAGVAAADPEAIMALYAADAVVQDPVGSEPRVGKAAVAAFYEGVRGIDVKTTRLGPVCVVGQHAVFQFHLSGAVRDQPVEMCSTDVMTFDDAGKIIAMTAYPDTEAKVNP
jgi:steroid delta-isomerase